MVSLGVLIACGDHASSSRPETPDAAVDSGGDAGGGSDAAPSAVAITFTNQSLYGQSLNATLVAYQDGDGPWREVTGHDGVYELSITSGRYGLFAGCVGPMGDANAMLDYFAVSDGTARYGQVICGLDSSSIELAWISGTLSNVADTDDVTVNGSRASRDTGWTLAARPGPATLVGLRQPTGDARPDGILLQPIVFADHAVFDLDFAHQFAPAERELVLDPPELSWSMATRYIDDTRGNHLIDEAELATTYRAVPADRLNHGLTELSVYAGHDNTSRSATRIFKEPIAQRLAMPAAFEPTSPPQYVARGAALSLTAMFAKRAEASYYGFTYVTPSSQAFRRWDVIYSAAWANQTPGTELVVALPDLSALPGWTADFEPMRSSLGPASWYAVAVSAPASFTPGAYQFRADGRTDVFLQDGDELSDSSSHGLLP
jgi:hypothetical protein